MEASKKQPTTVRRQDTIRELVLDRRSRGSRHNDCRTAVDGLKRSGSNVSQRYETINTIAFVMFVFF